MKWQSIKPGSKVEIGNLKVKFPKDEFGAKITGIWMPKLDWVPSVKNCIVKVQEQDCVRYVVYVIRNDKFKNYWFDFRLEFNKLDKAKKFLELTIVG